MKTLGIVIVNWNSGGQLADCVNSILESSITKFSLDKIVVVDNYSTDNSLTLLPKHDKLLIVRNKKNYGFGKACNIGALLVNSDLILFLNPDTRLTVDTLDIAVNYFVRHAITMKFGLLGIKLIDARGNIQRSCARFPSAINCFFDATGLSKLFRSKSLHMSNFDHNKSCFVDHVIGAFFLMGKKLFENLNGFDEDFFVYLEDLDFSYRAGKLGYKSYFLADTSAMHVGGGCSEQIKATRLFYSLNSRITYTKKHFNIVSHALVMVLTLIVEPCSRIIFSLLKRDLKGVFETIIGYKMLYSKLLS